MSSWTEVFRGRFGVYTLLLNIGILFFAVDNFLINTLMPSIVADIGGVAFYAWAMMLYLVGSIMGAASYGPLRARIGGRRSFAVGGAVFSLGALGCSIAPAIGELLVARLFQGVGGGLILAGSMAFISVLFEPRAAQIRGRRDQCDLDHRCGRRTSCRPAFSPISAGGAARSFSMCRSERPSSSVSCGRSRKAPTRRRRARARCDFRSGVSDCSGLASCAWAVRGWPRRRRCARH